MVHGSEAGYTASELKDVLHVKTKHALTQLARSGRLQREQFDSVYPYLSGESQVADRQRKARKVHLKCSTDSLIVVNPDIAAERSQSHYSSFLQYADEPQRRLYAGLESLKLGHGGDAHIASLLGMNPHTVALGRQELIGGDLSRDRVRAEGGGWLPQAKKRPKS